jgi:hypothetical protein
MRRHINVKEGMSLEGRTINALSTSKNGNGTSPIRLLGTPVTKVPVPVLRISRNSCRPSKVYSTDKVYR